MPAAITFHSVRQQYNERVILTDFSYSFPKNKITAILGKSGSGKTTLLQLINGMVKPQSGQVEIFGEPIDYKTPSPLRMRMGYVIQQAGLFPHFTVAQNIAVLGAIQKQSDSAIKDRTIQLLKLINLPEVYLQKYPHQLSGGEQQRVGMARAMFLNPPVLLMDEPFASLDYETKREIYQRLSTIQETEPRTIVIVTHDWEEAQQLADHFVWLEHGSIKASGDNQALLELKSKIFGN